MMPSVWMKEYNNKKKYLMSLLKSGNVMYIQNTDIGIIYFKTWGGIKGFVLTNTCNVCYVVNSSFERKAFSFLQKHF